MSVCQDFFILVNPCLSEKSKQKTLKNKGLITKDFRGIFTAIKEELFPVRSGFLKWCWYRPEIKRLGKQRLFPRPRCRRPALRFSFWFYFPDFLRISPPLLSPPSQTVYNPPGHGLQPKTLPTEASGQTGWWHNYLLSCAISAIYFRVFFGKIFSRCYCLYSKAPLKHAFSGSFQK